MGAHAAGELASKLAADTIPHSYQKRIDQSPSEAIVGAVREANEVIYNKGQHTVDFQGMGTTCSCLVLLPNGAMAAHVGDSRVYRLRNQRFEQLTFDHSLVWEMAAAGQATEDEIPAYVPKNVITRSLGPHPTVAVDVEGPFPLESGDRFLLCSDGLTGPLKPELIGMVLGTHSPSEAARTLIDLANLLGGPDNITVVVAEVLQHGDLGRSLPSPGESAPQARRGNSLPRWGWVGMALFGLLALGLGASGYIAPAAVAGIACFVTLVAALVRRGSDCGCAIENVPGLHGKAPYRCYDCQPSAAGIETLSEIVRQLEDLEGQQGIDLDWKDIRADREAAYDAIARGDYTGAVVRYSSAVRRLMRGLRESGVERPSDSTVDLG
jgi:protein phosphatase